MLKPGDTIAGCTIIAECGQGAYGCVYLAKDVLGRTVAVKQLTSISSGEYELKGLQNYIKLVQPCEALIQIYHCGKENELVFYVMEAADNASENPDEYQPDTLALRLKRNNGRLPAETMLPICHKLLDGLEVLHNSGLVHRDIKPENVIFVNGLPKLADPGLVRNMEQTLSVAGSPGYIAPEYFSGKAPLSPALDIYALGKLLYHCVTGCNPADFPLLPDDMPPELLFQVCHPLLRLCNDSLEQRCKTVAECREVLPRELVPRNAILRFKDALYVQPKFRARVLRCVIAFIVALLILLGAGLYGRRIMHQRQQALEAQLMRLSVEMQQMQEASSVLDMQLASLNTPSIGNLLKKAKSLLDAKDANAAEIELNAVKDKLCTLAIESIPAKLDDFQGCAQGWGFLASPLAHKYLPQMAQQDFKERLQHSSSKLAGSAGPKLGSDFTQATYGLGTAVFVSPGMFFSPVLKTQRTISYPYWIYNKEISGDQFYKTTFFLYRRNAPFQAAEYLAWNEALYFCWKANQILQKAAFLPEGYGVRPPTEEEWEYAALGGWEGKCAKDGPKIKNGANQAPGQGEPNALGLWNMEDNLSEIVLPYKEKPFKPDYAVAVRGGNYKEKSSIALRHLYIPDQMHMSGGGGLRPVIAPIEKDFWEKHWFRGVPIKSAEIKGNIYAGWSCCFATLGWKHAIQLASDLGGSLIECTDFAEIKDIYSKLELLNSFPCPIGIRLENGAWKRVSDNTPVPLDLPRDEKKTGLWATTSKLVPFVEDRGGPTMIIRWQDKKAFDRRGASFLEKATVARFQANGHNYAICRLGNMTSYMVRSFAEFAGCKLPVFKDSNEVNAVLENMPANFDNVALGTSRYYDKWEQPDGSSFPASNMVKEPKEANGAINTWTAKMLNIIVISNKELTENHRAEYLLLQL